ncbi:(myosin heavy-chain) kinase : Transcriptional regulator, XRE family OS=Streptomyces iranensis GN=SIRAN5266 PE=4 SV=1: PQQ_2: WD40 [Gemmataceae bacterium]|nr:(myosin heavy-chain) kinase : Transcriptional regulator, XRE family OS=Streptomyces iranensis GN=SIRAN5266 PE=4 SV=1: PQQ_2: WD40 [Gemmataceae bacterium]VTT97452.1 (myosin heavy-chain) kinase : Transcriptional regulator, XRE family OS=Streptomyces iranensis GN=SIRAN5266 PE=4 SV=1: PQQ_2: WD40 [Gemmataceae bacterium]
MTARRFWTAFALSLFPALVALAADGDDPLPDGAKARLGTARLRSTSGSPTAITPNGRFLAGPTPGGTIGFLELNGDVTRAVRVDGEFGTVVAFSADVKRALSVGYQAAFVWDTGSGKVLAKAARSVLSGDNAAALSRDGKVFVVGGTKSFNEKDKDKLPTVTVWDVDGNKEAASIRPAQNETVYAALSPDGKRVATWGYHADRDAKEPPKPEADPNRLVQFWTADGKETGKARLLTGSNPATVAFSPDGSLAAVSGGEGAIYLFDPATGTAKGQLLGRSRQGRRLAFSPDGKTLASAGEDGAVQRWTVADGKRLGTTEPPVPLTYPRGLLFTDNERAVAWSNRGSATFAWEVPSGKLLTPAGGHINPVTSAAVAGGGKEVFTAASDGVVIRWDPATGKELGTLPLKTPQTGYGSGVVTGTVYLTADGTRALANDGNGLAVYDLPAGTQQFVIPTDYNRENRAVFTPDGAKVVQLVSSYDAKKNPSRVVVWDVAAAKKLGEVDLPGLTQVQAALSPDGKTLVTAATRPEEKGESAFVVTGWDLATGKKLGEFTEPGGYGAMTVAATADNKTAAVLSPKSGPIVVDFVVGTKVRALDLGGKRPGGQLAVSSDGKLVAVATQAGFGASTGSPVVVFEADTGKVKKTISGGPGNLNALAFSPDGKLLVSGSYDTTALVWDLSEK